MMKIKTKLKLQVEQELCLITLTNIDEINSYVDEGSGFVMDHNIELKRIIINETFFVNRHDERRRGRLANAHFIISFSIVTLRPFLICL